MPYLNFLIEEKFLSRSEDLSPTVQQSYHSKAQHTKIALFYGYIDLIQEPVSLLKWRKKPLNIN